MTGYILSAAPFKARFDTVHVAVRHMVTAALLAVGLYSLVFSAPIITNWLAVKFILVTIRIKRRFVTINGKWGQRQVHYRLAGEGPALIVLHQPPSLPANTSH